MKKVTRILAAVVLVIVAAAVLVANTNGGMELMNDAMLACSDCILKFSDALACSDCIIKPLAADTLLS